jgi:hypothetical protein
MAVIFHVLKEEFERLKEAESAYSKAIQKMPRGSPRIEKRRNKKYLYLQYRDGKRVSRDYIGAADSSKASKVIEKISQRRRYEKLLKETKTALKEVRKALRGKI